MRGDIVRSARMAKGWTQQDLARRLGVSQPYVSLIERGRAGTPGLFRKLQRLLKLPEPQSVTAPAVTAENEDGWPGPPNSSPRRITIAGWSRPSRSGDLIWSSEIGKDAVVIGAVDVAGHGPGVFPHAVYVRGIVDGALRDLESAPRMDVLGGHVASVLRRADVEAAWFLAILRLPSDGHDQAVLYESVSAGYPAPLLFTGPPFESLPSTAPMAAPAVLHTLALDAPLRIVLASDGLLRRLGAGDESKGRRSLFSWQTGPQRDRDPKDHLSVVSAPVDDESLLVVTYADWDREYRFDVADSDEKARTKRDIETRVVAARGSHARPRVLRALSEALSNVQQHAYQGPGMVTVRVRCTATMARIEIADHGRGGQIEPGDGTKLIRAAASHVDVRRNHPAGTIVHITI